MNESEPLQKHTLNLYEGHFERVQKLFPEVGAAAVIRRLIKKFLEEEEPRANMTKVREPVQL